jgi:DNA end-binding protein Ku
VSDAELSIACQFVDALASKFDPAQYQDSYRVNMLSLIEQKNSGSYSATPAACNAKKPPVGDITDALFASIAAARSARASAGGVQ